MRKSVLVISGTRADFGLLESIILELEKSKRLNPLLVVTGMHTLKKFGYTISEIIKSGFAISKEVKISERGDMLGWLAEEIQGIFQYCRKVKVDSILVLGDRDEMLAGAIVGAHLGIRVGHIHGGDLTGQSVVDSANRNVITCYSTFHFAATKKSSTRIKTMLGSDNNVYLVGSPAIDQIKNIKKISKKKLGIKLKIDHDKKWFMLMTHSEPLSQLKLKEQISRVIEAISNLDGQIIWIYPNSDTGSDIFIDEIKKFAKKSGVSLWKNFDRETFVHILQNCEVLIGNSSAGIIECSFLKVPVVNIGDRQKGREKSGNVIDSTYNVGQIRDAVSLACSDSFKRRVDKTESIYGEGNSGNKIVKILEKNL